MCTMDLCNLVSFLMEPQMKQCMKQYRPFCNVGVRSYNSSLLMFAWCMPRTCSQCELDHQETTDSVGLWFKIHDTAQQTEPQSFSPCIALISKVDTYFPSSFIWWWRAVEGLFCAAAPYTSESGNDKKKSWTMSLEGMRQVWSKKVDLTSTNLIPETIIPLWHWKSREEMQGERSTTASQQFIWRTPFQFDVVHSTLFCQQQDNTRFQITQHFKISINRFFKKVLHESSTTSPTIDCNWTISILYLNSILFCLDTWNNCRCLQLYDPQLYFPDRLH